MLLRSILVVLALGFASALAGIPVVPIAPSRRHKSWMAGRGTYTGTANISFARTLISIPTAGCPVTLPGPCMGRRGDSVRRLFRCQYRTRMYRLPPTDDRPARPCRWSPRAPWTRAASA